tara:strand:+ start:172 stop:924 length:753 start_codon:yes stop_codon:yes gene_type:complete
MKRIRSITVRKIHQLSPNMKRITFASKDFYDFPENESGGYIKFLFNKKASEKNESLARPYTIRNFRKNKLELDVDFSFHSGDKGYATKWACEANVGDKIKISGPGSKQLINNNSNWFFFIGDMTALPAIGSYLEQLHNDSKGYVVVEIASVDDKVNLKKPKQIKIKWIVKSNNKNIDNFLNAVREVKWFDKKPYIWVACEFTKMKFLRDYFQKEKKICKNEMYISSYWKSGLVEEEHKIIKKEDSLVWNG